MENLTAQVPNRPAGVLWHRVWLDAYPCDVPSSIPYPRMPVSGLLDMAVRRYPDRPVCTIYNQAFTYSEVAEQAKKLARSLAALGAGPGRRVGMLLPNIPEYIAALQATWLTGATALQLSPLMVAEEVGAWAPGKAGCIASSACAATVLLVSARRIASTTLTISSAARSPTPRQKSCR